MVQAGSSASWTGKLTTAVAFVWNQFVVLYFASRCCVMSHTNHNANCLVPQTPLRLIHKGQRCPLNRFIDIYFFIRLPMSLWVSGEPTDRKRRIRGKLLACRKEKWGWFSRGQKFWTTTSKISNLSMHSLHTNIKTHTLPSAQEANGEALLPSVRVPHSRRSFRRSKQVLLCKKQPVGPWRKWQPYLHAIFLLIIPNLNMA